MNRSVLARQMFAKGGQAVPNEYKGFSKLPEEVQMKMDPVAAKKYAEGGIASMMPSPTAASPAMPPEMADSAVGQVMDPQVIENALTSIQQEIGDLEEADDYETVINSIRGDELPIEDRYEELAGIVGEEDARQTPESVLALVQPAMVMGAVDQGIGGLAQAQMTEPVEGNMAGGIMSTVEPPQPAGGMGGPPPVNFKEGGLVRRGDNQPVKMMQAGGDPFAGVEGRLGELARERMAVRQGLIGDPSARLQEQKDLTKSQILFDLANTALAFAGPMEGERKDMSAAERLAMAARTTQLPQTIGARAAKLGEFKTGLDKEKQALQLAALGSAETALAAEAKAAEAIKLQELKATQELSKIKLQSKLDLGVKSKIEELAQAGRLDLQNLKGYQNMDLEQLKQAGAINLEGYRQANREIQEGVLQQNRIDIEKLKATGRKADAILANKLEQDNIVLRGNIELGRMQVANEFELEKMEIGHGYATELQNSRLAVQESIASNRLSFDEAQAKLNQARADKELAVKEGNLELQRAAEERITVFEQQTMDLKEREVVLKEQEARLGKLNVEGKNKAQQILARPELLEGYANGTLGEAETLAVNSAIDQLSTRETLPGPDGTTIKTGGNIPEAARQAVIARSKLPVSEGQTRLMPRDVERITAEPIQFGEAVSRIMKDIPDVSIAFGSDAVARNVINVATEALTFGYGKAPFESTEKAISAVKQLNLTTLTHFQKVLELRDSVALMKELKAQTANPNEFLTGDTRAKNKTKTVLDTIDEAISMLDLQIQNATDVQEANRHKLAKQRSLQLRTGFEAIDRAYARKGSGGRTTTPEIEAEQDKRIQRALKK